MAENICIVTYCRRRPPDWFCLSDSSFSEGVPEEFCVVSHPFSCDLLAAVGMGTRILNWHCGGLRMPSFHLHCSSPGCLSPTECFFKGLFFLRIFTLTLNGLKFYLPFVLFQYQLVDAANWDKIGIEFWVRNISKSWYCPGISQSSLIKYLMT